MGFIGPLILLLFAMLVLCGLFVFILGVRGRIEWTNPMCAKCRYDLRGLNPEEQTVCPECGNKLAGPRGVRFGCSRRNWKLVVVGLLLLVSPLLILGGQQVRQTTQLRVAATRPNERILEDLAKNAADTAAWNQLFDRYLSGAIDDAHIETAIEHLIAHFEASGGAGNQRFRFAEQFLKALVAEERIEAEQFARLAKAYYKGQPGISMPSRVRSGGEFTFRLDGIWDDFPGTELLYAIRKITLNGEELKVAPWGAGSFRRRSDLLSGAGRWGIRGNLALEAEPGEHEVVFEIDFGATALPGVYSPGSPPGGAEEWVEPLFSEVREVRVPVKVLALGESPIELVTSPNYEREIVSSLRISGLRIGMDHGRQSAELIFYPSDPPVPLSFKLFIRVGELEHGLGSFRARGRSVGRSNYKQYIANLENIEAVDVILRPDPEEVETEGDWSEIWGKEIVIENVKVLGSGISKDAMRNAMRAALQVHSFNPGGKLDDRRTRMPSLNMNVTSTPVPARFQVLIRSGDDEYEIATLDAGPDDSNRSGSAAVNLPDDVQAVTVIFRPNLDEKELLQRTGYWDEEIIFENVPVVRE